MVKIEILSFPEKTEVTYYQNFNFSHIYFPTFSNTEQEIVALSPVIFWEIIVILDSHNSLN